jgi:cysteine desulfurase
MLFVDATQALGKVPVKVAASGADLVAIASHKIGGPSGAGALWVRRGLQVAPLVLGGAQERGRRAGSPPLSCLVGFGGACALLRDRLAAQGRLEALRNRVEAAFIDLGALINADAGPRVSTVVNMSMRGWSGAELVAALDLEGVCVSAGAACSSGLVQPSPVLRAMYPEAPWRADSAVRFSFGVETVESDIEFALAAARRVLARGVERYA